MNKFKVGDRVRTLNSRMVPKGSGGVPKGSVGVVMGGVWPPAAGHVPVVFDDHRVQGSATPWYMAEASLELVVEQQPAAERVLPDDASREQYPLYDGLLAYFPAALAEIARWSKVGNDKHNPGEPLHWARDKSTDHENKILRHLIDARHVNKEGFVEAVAMCWRALALCQEILEERGWAEGPNARRTGTEA